jgi:CRISPR type I-D-associated protein Csc1
MEVFHYRVTLLDSVYFAREGLSGAVTPPLLHATALNCAVETAANLAPAQHPFVMCKENGGRNIPRYENSLISDVFYMTPAQPLGPIDYRVEIAKGENDGLLRIQQRDPDRKRGIQRIDVRNQPLRYCTLHFLPPETEFSGFVFLRQEGLELPQLIRLGSFRAPASINWVKATRCGLVDKPAPVAHAVDPLVTKVTRGVMANMLPYGVVQNATAVNVLEAKFPYPPEADSGNPRKKFRIAGPDAWEMDSPDHLPTRAEGTVAL